MNKRVLQAFIMLMWLFLIGFSILKIFFAEWFLTAVSNEKIISIGNYIDNSLILRIIVDSLIGIVTMHFYLCSCKQVWVLQPVHYLIMLAYALSVVFLELLIPQFTPIIDLLAVVVAPILLSCNFKQTALICFLHYAGQAALLFLRSEPLYLAGTNYAVVFILVLDVYVWLLLYYLYSNLYKEETLWNYLLSHFSEIRRRKNLKQNSRK